MWLASPSIYEKLFEGKYCDICLVIWPKKQSGYYFEAIFHPALIYMLTLKKVGCTFDIHQRDSECHRAAVIMLEAA